MTNKKNCVYSEMISSWETAAKKTAENLGLPEDLVREHILEICAHIRENMMRPKVLEHDFFGILTFRATYPKIYKSTRGTRNYQKTLELLIADMVDGPRREGFIKSKKRVDELVELSDFLKKEIGNTILMSRRVKDNGPNPKKLTKKLERPIDDE